MIKVSMSEMKKKFDYYIELAQKEDILITKYGKPVAIMRGLQKEVDIDALVGKYNPEGKDVDPDKLLEDAIMEKCGFKR